jgi:hypothetical protein
MISSLRPAWARKREKFRNINRRDKILKRKLVTSALFRPVNLFL